MKAEANGFAHAFSTWIAGGGGLSADKKMTMRYNEGPMKGMTRDQAQMNFQNNVWKNAAPEWKDEYAKRATTDMLSPSEQTEAQSARRSPVDIGSSDEGNQMPGGMPTVSAPMFDEGFRGSADDIRDGSGNAQPAGSRPVPMGGSPSTIRPPIMQKKGNSLATSQPVFGSRNGTGASEKGMLANAKSNQPSFGNRAGTGASQTGRVAQVKF